MIKVSEESGSTRERGASIIEYMVIVSFFLLIAIIAAERTLGRATSESFSSSRDAIENAIGN